MRLVFLIPLTTAIISGYISQKTSQEIAYLTGSVTVISLLASLILAPWQVQCIILIAALIVAQQLWQRLNDTGAIDPESSQEVAETETEHNVNKYRGVDYEPTPAKTDVNLDSEVVEGLYRGSPSALRKNTPTIPVVRKKNLKYRGASIPDDNSENS